MQLRQSFARKAKHFGAKRAKFFEQAIYGRRKRMIGNDASDKSETMRLRSADLPARENEIRGGMQSDQARQRYQSDGRKAAELDFRLAELRGFCGENKVAKSRQLHAAAEAVAMHGGDGYAVRGRESAEYRVKSRKHFCDALRSVIGDVSSRTECLHACTLKNNEVRFRQSALERLVQ